MEKALCSFHYLPVASLNHRHRTRKKISTAAGNRYAGQQQSASQARGRHPLPQGSQPSRACAGAAALQGSPEGPCRTPPTALRASREAVRQCLTVTDWQPGSLSVSVRLTVTDWHPGQRPQATVPCTGTAVTAPPPASRQSDCWRRMHFIHAPPSPPHYLAAGPGRNKTASRPRNRGAGRRYRTGSPRRAPRPGERPGERPGVGAGRAHGRPTQCGGPPHPHLPRPPCDGGY